MFSFIFLFLVDELIARTLENIIDVKGKVKSEITVLKEKLKLARETIAKFKTELAKVQGTSASTSAAAGQMTH